MDISEVKYNLGKPVRLILPRHYVDGEFILSGCIIRKSTDGNFFYQAELTDQGNGSVIIAGLDNISKISSPTVGGRKEGKNIE